MDALYIAFFIASPFIAAGLIARIVRRRRAFFASLHPAHDPNDPLDYDYIKVSQFKYSNGDLYVFVRLIPSEQQIQVINRADKRNTIVFYRPSGDPVTVDHFIRNSHYKCHDQTEADIIEARARQGIIKLRNWIREWDKPPMPTEPPPKPKDPGPTPTRHPRLEYNAPLWKFKTYHITKAGDFYHITLEFSPDQILYFEDHPEIHDWQVYEYALEDYRIIRNFIVKPHQWRALSELTKWPHLGNGTPNRIRKSINAFQWQVWQHAHYSGVTAPGGQPPKPEDIIKRVLGEDDED
jgi:hypothetical protein